MKKTLYVGSVFVICLLFIIYTQSTGTISVVAVGDIAVRGGRHAEVADLITRLNPDKVLVLGDTVYDSGTTEEFATLYDPSFGAFKDKTAPSPGNHEYKTPNASGYYDYFGELAGPDRRGFYSFDMGSWHLISLNSEVLTDEQLAWLSNDLGSTVKPCVLAYWHKPYLSSGERHGPNQSLKPFWDLLHRKGVDLVLNGHEHAYERFGRVNPDNIADPKGIRQVIVGTGGAKMYGFGAPISNSEVRQSGSYGTLEITLKESGYSAEFKSVDGSFSDNFSSDCNEK